MLFLDCSSFLLSASSRCFCNCVSSIFLFCMRSFFSWKYATVSLPLLRRFGLGAVSFSTSSFLCLFCDPPRFCRALYLISAVMALSTFLFVILRCFFNHSFFFYYPLKCFFNVTQICIYLTCLFFISHLCSKFVAQKRISFSDRSLRHSELGMLKAVQIVRYFIPNLAPCKASFLCLEWFKNENLLTKNMVILFSPLHVGSKDKNKILTLIFSLFVLHVVCLFFFTASRTPFCSPNMQDTFTNINNPEIVIY